MEETKLKVSGMHCRSCETLVKEEVGAIEGVREVEADHRRGLVTVRYEGGIDLNKVKKAVEGLGYKVVE